MSRCSNTACGVHWLDPQPEPGDLGIAYRDYHTHEEPGAATSSNRSGASDAYAATKLGVPAITSRTSRLKGRLLGLSSQRANSALYAHFYLPPKRGGTLLEVGCGSGEHLQRMKDDGWAVRGIDFDPAAVTVARARGLDVMVGEIRDQGLPDASFDAVVMAQLFEHVYDPPALLAECTRLLAPGGRLVCITPNADALGHRVYGRDWRGLEPPRHLTIYTPRALRLAATRAGLAIDTLRDTARDASNMFLASRRIAHATGGALIERPRVGRRPPVHLRLLASLESIGSSLGLGWGEEIVLMARKPGVGS